jgi:nucleotide-binding universal stress UspA family protein
MKVLLAVDGSKYTKKMLAYLATHAELLNTSNQYVIFTVSPDLPPEVEQVVGGQQVKKYHQDEAEKILAAVDKFLLRHGVAAKSSYKVGNPGDAIAKFAKSGKFDLVVMGSHGHGAWASLIMGSVANQVLAHCETPVLLVR